MPANRRCSSTSLTHVIRAVQLPVSAKPLPTAARYWLVFRALQKPYARHPHAAQYLSLFQTLLTVAGYCYQHRLERNAMVAYEAPENASPQVQTFTAFINALAAFESEGILANLDDEAFEFNVAAHEIKEADNALTVQADGISKLGTPFNNEYILVLRFELSKIPGELPKIGVDKALGNSAFTRDFRVEEQKKREAE
ncbi:hypothetical protein DFS33DRAFT_1273525 [Desarmillaria ectypa]|nr:hypothetical protein DFS33DRAFT_1273525 [Desarmillaria ectypa]